MKIKYYLLTLLVFTLTFNACKKDDDDGPISVPIADRGEQQVKDNDSLIGYLETHYYNSTELAGIIDPSINDIVITELEEGNTLPAGHTFLIDDVTTKTTVYEETDYTYYVLELNQGGGTQPNFTDKINLNYSGNLQDGVIFDSTINADNSLDLTVLIPGWNRVIPSFNTSESYIENPDGTVSYSNYGIGVMFLPSGLGYFSVVQTDIPIYSNLIFKFELFQAEVNDHDADGIPTHIEDLNSNLDLRDDDTNANDFPNYVDADDDGDGVATINELEPNEHTINLGDPDPEFEAKEYEISRSELGGIVTIKTVIIVDADNNGIDDYLDKDVTTDYSEE